MKCITTVAIVIIFCTCNRPQKEKLKENVAKYIKDKVKNPGSYKAIYFSEIDTSDIKEKDFTVDKPRVAYSLWHLYEIQNSQKQAVHMSVSFEFDSALQILSTYPEGLNGDDGILTGNVYWKYNNYVGNRPDAGSKAVLYAIDTLRKETHYEATCDVMGNFKIEKVPAGRYLLIVTSKNTTSSLVELVEQLRLYHSYFNELFGFDIKKSMKPELDQYELLDSLYRHALFGDDKDYGSRSKRYDTYKMFEIQKNEQAGKILANLPATFKLSMGIYGGYPNKIDVSYVTIEENKTSNEVIDFGITYF